MNIRTISIAVASCLAGGAGFIGAVAMAGSEHATWSCNVRPLEKHCKPAVSTETITIPGTTVTLPGVTTPGSVTTLPPETVTVTTPAPPPTTVTVTSPPVTVTVKTPPAKHGVKAHQQHKVKPKPKHHPKVIIHHGAGVTG